MVDPSSTRAARSRLDLQAIHELLDAQRRRVRTYAEEHRPRPPVTRSAPTAQYPVPPSAQQILDAVPNPALLLAPVVDGAGRIQDILYVTQNAAARAYATERLAPSVPPTWTAPVSLYEHFPAVGGTPVPGMIARAYHEGTVQGPETIEWIADTPSGPIRINDQVQITPCGEHVLVVWERGHRLRMAAAAQQLVRVCWAEWNLGDHGVEPSGSFRQVLGLDTNAPLPGLAGLAHAASPESLPGLYQALYDVILRKRTTDCELRLRGAGDRVIRMTAEPIRIAPGSLVWAVRGVLVDVTAERRRRDAAERAEREARRQQERAEAVADVANALREAVLPHFQDELAAYGLEAAAVYRPDAREAGVGGDWYKARRLPGDRLLIALGDARGHGLEAVTLMAKLRYALAGLAYTEQRVEQLTQWLNELACADGIESTATAIIARYHPEIALLRWTCAGHPVPVLVRSGRTTQLPLPAGGPGLPVGVLPGAVYSAAAFSLEIGDIVLLYTDGLTERRGHDPDEDTERFLAAARECFADAAPGAGREDLLDYARRLVARLDGPHRHDDATLLALRRITPRTPPARPAG
ncbi:PP2C family protein-serine/threonine phosphatase [Streptomyces longispororuber]|uniref:PP2C family protein-serine/threonine phosphatase n=1 Tax=Streptomyces longispororuber TaxID=68230 RepID=UPI002108C6D2|nr:PP2C family protein-serine/threonine phosphatase [Streptomyces longispororuber]MCQ4208831.1 serine/threonine-protein phosphatase [Streptomyces longispororuber]